MKKLAILLSAAMALTTTAFAQTAADVEATTDLNQHAEIQMVDQEVKVSEVGDDAVSVEETVTVTETEPNME